MTGEAVFVALFDVEVNRLSALENSSGVSSYLLIQVPELTPNNSSARRIRGTSGRDKSRASRG